MLKYKEAKDYFRKIANKEDGANLATSGQAGDYYSAVAPVFGVDSRGNFNPNSPAVDPIYQELDKIEYKGTVMVQLAIDTKKSPSLILGFSSPITQSNKTSLVNFINKTYLPKIKMAISKVPPPSENIILHSESEPMVQIQTA